MAVNSLFKKLKVNFDEIKVMINELSECQQAKTDYFLLEKEILDKDLKVQSQEYRLRAKFDVEVQE